MNKTILVIEDDESIAEVVTIILEAEGYSVITDNTGDLILKGTAKKPINLILVDYLLPGTTGVEIINHLKKDRARAHIPVVLMSANTEKELAELAASCRANTYLPKPFDVDSLIQMVKTLIH